jgi:hypothetical protein
VHAACEAGRHNARAPRPGERRAWVHGSDLKRDVLELGSQGCSVAAHGPKSGPTRMEDAPIGWARTGREKNKEDGEMGRWRKTGRAS